MGSKRFPLLLHHLDQHRDLVEAAQWQDWGLALLTDTVTIVHYLLFLSLQADLHLLRPGSRLEPGPQADSRKVGPPQLGH